MDNIQQLQYDNLRKNFNNNLVNPILGEDYYNMASDVYGADIQTTLDLKLRYYSILGKLHRINHWLLVSIILNVILISIIIYMR